MHKYQYKAKIVRIIDGDTLVLDIDMGFRVRSQQHIRVRFLDTPEMFSGSDEERAEGRRAALYALQILRNREVTVIVYKDDSQSFNRWCGDILIDHQPSMDFAKRMVQARFEKLPEYSGSPARHFNAKRRAENLENAGVEEYYEIN